MFGCKRLKRWVCAAKGLNTMHILFSGILIWFVVSELFFGFSANKVYAKALKKVKASAEVRNEKLDLSRVLSRILYSRCFGSYRCNPNIHALWACNLGP